MLDYPMHLKGKTFSFAMHKVQKMKKRTFEPANLEAEWIQECQSNDQPINGAKNCQNHITADNMEAEEFKPFQWESPKFKNIRMKILDESSPQLTTLLELDKILLKRSQLVLLLNNPDFDELVIGCFVRINNKSAENNSLPNIAEIVAVQKIKHKYQLDSKQTKRVLQLNHGGYRSSYQMNIISNQAATGSEFSYFLEFYKRNGQSLPQLSRIEQKQMDIKRAMNSEYIELLEDNKINAEKAVDSAIDSSKPLAVELQPEDNKLMMAADLHELHNFKIRLNTSKLMKFGELFPLQEAASRCL